MAQMNVTDKIQETFEVLSKNDETIHIRILNTKKGTTSGFFDDPQIAAASVEPYIGKHDIYMALNHVNPDLLSRCKNRLEEYAKSTTSDSDITGYQYLLIDLDPIRASGISSTDAEKKHALELAKTIRKYLHEQGFGVPIICDSGNGYHLLYSTDLPNTSTNVNLVSRFLEALDFHFSTDKVQVDRTTFNPSRVVKLYGTKACKGDSTEERPHRWSKILKVPENLKTISAELIENIASQMPKLDESQSSRGKAGDKFDIEEWLNKYRVDYSRKASFHNKGMKYILRNCPWNSDHTNESAYVIQFDSGAIAAGCLHNSCANENWGTLRKLCEPDLPASSPSSGDEKVSDVLVRLAKSDKLFLNQHEQAFVAVMVKGHEEIMEVDSQRYKLHLLKLYYDSVGSTVGTDSLNQAVQQLKMLARYSDSIYELNKRIAMQDDVIYYDLCNPEWSVIKITASSVEKLDHPPILFTRTKNMVQQPEPELSTDPTELIPLVQKHFRFKKSQDIILFAVYLVSCFLPHIGHTVLALFGEKGSAKSTTMQRVKAIVDPAKQDLLTMPTSIRDLGIILNNNYMAMFDNLDTLSSTISNILCMAATGGSILLRELYTNSELTILELMRCIGLNGINVVTTRPDLLDRAVLLELERISKTERRGSNQLLSEFQSDLPKFLGAIFNTVSKVLEEGSAPLDEVGRMADFTYYGYTIAEVIGVGGDEFLKAYLTNQNTANEEAISNHPVAAAVIALMRNQAKYSDSVARFLMKLDRIAIAEKINTRVRLWPADASACSKRLKEVKSNLEDVGIYYSISNAGSFKRITIENRNIKQCSSLEKSHPAKSSGATVSDLEEEDLFPDDVNSDSDSEVEADDEDLSDMD